MTVQHHLDYRSHVAVMWGYPGSIMKIHIRVVASNNPRCKVGTMGRATLFASYNGVRSDSVQFFFPRACKRQSHLYHGTQSTTRYRRCNCRRRNNYLVPNLVPDSSETTLDYRT
jgi:hypothetical protein